MRYPVSKPYLITDTFGNEYYGKSKTKRAFRHSGTDFAFYAGDGQVYAPHAGTVIDAGYDSARGYYVVLRSRAGMYVSHFFHLAKDMVFVGETVKEGEHIATMGMTGNVTGPHLHWTLYRLGKRVDPLKYSKPPKEDKVGNLATLSDAHVYARLYTGDNATEATIKRHVNRKSTAELKKYLMKTKSYKKHIELAKEDKLDPKGHLPTEIRENYNHPSCEGFSEYKGEQLFVKEK